MNLFKKTFIIALLGLFLLHGCEDFSKIQSNPNLPETANPGLLLPSIIFPAVNTHVNNSRTLTHELMQYHVSINSTVNEVQRFILVPAYSEGVWNGFYGRMQDINDLIAAAEELGDSNYKAIGMILRAWMFSILTDTFGDIPYSEATKATSGIFTPKYDTQESIYMDLLDQLKEANSIIVPGRALPFGGDILYNGNMMNWKKFANSLRLRLLMRISNKDLALASAQINEIVANPSQFPLFDSNAEQAVYQYSGTLPNIFPPSDGNIFFFTIYVASEFIVEKLKGFNDPRLGVYFQPTEDSAAQGVPEFVGVPSGLSHGDAFGFNGGPSSQSFLNVNNFFNNRAQKGIIMKNAEVQFLLAEAAARNIITADPQPFYEKGIQASMNYWGVTPPDGYMNHPDIAWNGDIDQIYLQKYFALYWGGLEAWFDYRRTGRPQITPGPANLNNGVLPVRLVYPQIEQSLNALNYTQATQRIGGDHINIKGWWESFN